MSSYRYNSDSFQRLYQIGGADLALRYRDIAESGSRRNDISNDSSYRLKVVSLRFFNGGRSAPKEEDRQFKTRFSQGSAKYIYFQLTMRNPWRYAAYPYNLIAHYYYPDGTLMGEIKSSFKTNPRWDSLSLTRAWGWEEAGNWTPGDYRVEIHIENEQHITQTFTIYKEKRKDPALATTNFLSDLLYDPTSQFGSLKKPLWKGTRFNLRSEKDTELFRSERHNRQASPRSKRNTRPESSSKSTESGRRTDNRLSIPARGLGFDGWMKRLSKQMGIDEQDKQTASTLPEDDIGKMRWLMKIDQRYMAAMMQTRPGAVNKKVLQDLKKIAADYKTLLKASLPKKMPGYTKSSLRSKLADTHQSMGQVCGILRDYDQARRNYAAALKLYQQVGQSEDVKRCQENLERMDFSESGNTDREIARLRKKMAGVRQDSIDHADILIELAGHYCSNDDDFEAEKMLLQAEKMLDAKAGESGGIDIAAALTRSVINISENKHRGQATGIQTTMRVNGMYRQLAVLLSRIYKETDPLKAAHYRGKAAQRDSRETNNAFSRQMLNSLEDLINKK